MARFVQLHDDDKTILNVDKIVDITLNRNTCTIKIHFDQIIGLPAATQRFIAGTLKYTKCENPRDWAEHDLYAIINGGNK